MEAMLDPLEKPKFNHYTDTHMLFILIEQMPPSPEIEPVSEKLFSSEYLRMGNVQKVGNPECYARTPSLELFRIDLSRETELRRVSYFVIFKL
jgi:hypothetical protein